MVVKLSPYGEAGADVEVGDFDAAPPVTMTEREACVRILSQPKLRAALAAMWEWRQGCQELLPDGLAEKVLDALAEGRRI